MAAYVVMEGRADLSGSTFTTSLMASSVMVISKQRRCVDCHTTTTPLWRGGPAGPRSLCNACGIRYRKKKKNGKGKKGGGGSLKVIGEEEQAAAAALLLMPLSSTSAYV